MEKVFLDTNCFIDILEKRDLTLIDFVGHYSLYISAISIGTWAYIFKHRVPNSKFDLILATFNIESTILNLIERSFVGPTSDYEDNVQLHSATNSGCSIFMTRDKRLQKLRNFFGVKILSPQDL
jgi:predicted nucleic acid-binding protein